MNEALRDWVANVDTTFYIIGTVAGPHPYPAMVRDFLRGGMAPEKVGDLVVDAVLSDRFWVCTDLAMVARTAERHRALEENRNAPRLLGRRS